MIEPTHSVELGRRLPRLPLEVGAVVVVLKCDLTEAVNALTSGEGGAILLRWAARQDADDTSSSSARAVERSKEQ